MQIWLLVAVTGITLCSIPGFCTAGPQPQNDLEQAFYDMGVIGYCGLSTDAASAGFRRELERVVERGKINEQEFRAARNRAITMVQLEWDNRGLGGFRGWCRTEGAAAVKRFLAAPQ